MSKRSLNYLGGGIGATVGGLLPGLWGGSDLSGWGILLGLVGGVLGVLAANKLSG
jgi:hypothetical protein